MDGMYSVLINHGCHWKCPYCVVRNNHIDIPETDPKAVDATVDGLLERGLIRTLSLSGGGDPLFSTSRGELAARLDWYRSLADRLHAHGATFELHTSYCHSLMDRSPVPFDLITRHCRTIRQMDTVHRQAPVERVVFVVQDWMTEEDVRVIASKAEAFDDIDQLSFRQRIDPGYHVSGHLDGFLRDGASNFDGNGMHHNAPVRPGRWFYITQGDVNTYIVNDRMSTRYEDFVEGVR